MILRHLHLRRFKRFADWTVSFSPGLNVIYGPNEAGKSTLMEALFSVLFVDPEQLPPHFQEMVRPWGEQRLGEESLEFEVDHKAYVVRKDFEAGTVLLQEINGATHLENAREIRQRIVDWLGLANEGAFRSTAFVGQGELSRIADRRQLIGVQLSRILTGGGNEDVDAAVRWIETRRQHLTEFIDVVAGDQHLRRLEGQLGDLERREEREREITAELNGITPRLIELEARVKERGEQTRAAEQYWTLQRHREQLDQQIQTTRELLARLDELRGRLEEVQAKLQDLGDHSQTAVDDMVESRRKIQALQQELPTIRRNLAREEETLSQLATRHNRARRQSGGGLVLGGLGAAAVVAGMLLALFRGLPAGLVLAGTGLALILGGIRMRTRVARTGGAYRQQEQKVLVLRRQVEQTRGRLVEADREVRIRLQGLGVVSVEALEQRFTSYSELVRQQEGARKAAAEALGGRSREEVEGRLTGLEEERREVEAGLAALPEDVRNTAPALDRLKYELERGQRELVDLRERKANLEGTLGGLQEQSEQQQALLEQLAALRERRRLAEEELQVLDLARRGLDEARKQTFFSTRELLEHKTGEYLRLATKNVYSRVRIDERALMPAVWVPAAGGWKSPTTLSQGTVDQLYLSLRLALLEIVAEGRTPPLFLDEPFVHFDEERLKSVIPLLVAVSRQRQVFLLDLQLREDIPADNVIALTRELSPVEAR